MKDFVGDLNGEFRNRMELMLKGEGHHMFQHKSNYCLLQPALEYPDLPTFMLHKCCS